MRVAMVAACAFPALRGSQALIGELAEDLADLGHQIHLVTYPAGEATPSRNGLRIHPRRRNRDAASIEQGWRRLVHDIGLGINLYRVVRQEGIDVIHAHNYEAPVCAYVTRWLTGVPVVYHTHNALSDELQTYAGSRLSRTLARRIGQLLDRQVPRRADFTIALTPDLEDFLHSCGVRPSRVGVVPPGVAMETPVSGPRPGAEGRGFVVAYAGNLDRYQDLDVLFRAFLDFRRQVQNASLLIITHEQVWRRRAGWRLEELVVRGFARVVVAPTFADARGWLERSDVLVCPRSSWSGYPIKLLNYMATGKPVVAAEGSAKGITDGLNGLIFRDRDPQHLAAQLRRLHGDYELQQRLGAAARIALSKNHDRKKIASEIAQIHARLCSRRSGRSMRGGGRESGAWRRLKALLARRICALSSVRTTR
jgi:glycosyltransferase involved in cell wall biosynthesis